MKLQTAITLGSIMAVVGTVLLYVKVLAKKDDDELGKFSSFLKDYFSFRKFYLETLLKFIFTLATLASICIGFWMLYAKEYWGWYQNSYTLYGLCLMVGGPIALRIIYELLMMAVIAVRNITEINEKIGGDAISSKSKDKGSKATSKTQNDKIDELLKSGAITKEEHELMSKKAKKG